MLDTSTLIKEEKLIFKNFIKCIEDRSLESMKNPMYEYCHLHCGFIAHYDIHGFKHEYSDSRFIRFVEQFVSPPWYYTRGNTLYLAMCEVAHQHIDRIKYEFQNLHAKREIELMKTLARKHGYKVIATNESMDVEVNVESSGQLALLTLE